MRDEKEPGCDEHCANHDREPSQPAPASISFDEVLLRRLLARPNPVVTGLPSSASVAALHAVPGSRSGCAQVPGTAWVLIPAFAGRRQFAPGKHLSVDTAPRAEAPMD